MNILMRILGLLLAMAIVLAGCDSGGQPPTDRTRYFRFLYTHDSNPTTFVAATSDAEVLSDVEDQLEKPIEDRNTFITGPIERGNGGHNDDYPWHFAPNKWGLAEIAMEVCDGHPEYVSENVEYFVGEVGRYCPWSSKVLMEVDPPE